MILEIRTTTSFRKQVFSESDASDFDCWCQHQQQALSTTHLDGSHPTFHCTNWSTIQTTRSLRSLSNSQPESAGKLLLFFIKNVNITLHKSSFLSVLDGYIVMHDVTKRIILSYFPKRVVTILQVFIFFPIPKMYCILCNMHNNLSDETYIVRGNNDST